VFSGGKLYALSHLDAAREITGSQLMRQDYASFADLKLFINAREKELQGAQAELVRNFIKVKMLQKMKNKISMGWDDKQSILATLFPIRSRAHTNIGKIEEKEQQDAAARQTAELEGSKDHSLKKSSHHRASLSKEESDAKNLSGPDRRKQNRIARWIDYALTSTQNG